MYRKSSDCLTYLFFFVSFQLLEESLFLAFRPPLCSMVFSALVETNASLQITAASVLTLLAQQTGERGHMVHGQKSSSTSNMTSMSYLSGLLLDSDIELAVDHLTRLLLTEDDGSVRSACVKHLLSSGRLLETEFKSSNVNLWCCSCLSYSRRLRD